MWRNLNALGRRQQQSLGERSAAGEVADGGGPPVARRTGSVSSSATAPLLENVVGGNVQGHVLQRAGGLASFSAEEVEHRAHQSDFYPRRSVGEVVGDALWPATRQEERRALSMDLPPSVAWSEAPVVPHEQSRRRQRWQKVDRIFAAQISDLRRRLERISGVLDPSTVDLHHVWYIPNASSAALTNMDAMSAHEKVAIKRMLEIHCSIQCALALRDSRSISEANVLLGVSVLNYCRPPTQRHRRGRRSRVEGAPAISPSQRSQRHAPFPGLELALVPHLMGLEPEEGGPTLADIAEMLKQEVTGPFPCWQHLTARYISNPDYDEKGRLIFLDEDGSPLPYVTDHVASKDESRCSPAEIYGRGRYLGKSAIVEHVDDSLDPSPVTNESPTHSTTPSSGSEDSAPVERRSLHRGKDWGCLARENILEWGSMDPLMVAGQAHSTVVSSASSRGCGMGHGAGRDTPSVGSSTWQVTRSSSATAHIRRVKGGTEQSLRLSQRIRIDVSEVASGPLELPRWPLSRSHHSQSMEEIHVEHLVMGGTPPEGLQRSSGPLLPALDARMMAPLHGMHSADVKGGHLTTAQLSGHTPLFMTRQLSTLAPPTLSVESLHAHMDGMDGIRIGSMPREAAVSPPVRGSSAGRRGGARSYQREATNPPSPSSNDFAPPQANLLIAWDVNASDLPLTSWMTQVAGEAMSTALMGARRSSTSVGAGIEQGSPLMGGGDGQLDPVRGYSPMVPYAPPHSAAESSASRSQTRSTPCSKKVINHDLGGSGRRIRPGTPLPGASRSNSNRASVSSLSNWPTHRQEPPFASVAVDDMYPDVANSEFLDHEEEVLWSVPRCAPADVEPRALILPSGPPGGVQKTVGDNDDGLWFHHSNSRDNSVHLSNCNQTILSQSSLPASLPDTRKTAPELLVEEPRLWQSVVAKVPQTPRCLTTDSRLHRHRPPPLRGSLHGHAGPSEPDSAHPWGESISTPPSTPRASPRDDYFLEHREVE